MARLGPTGLNQLLTDIKNWVNSKLSTKADTAHTHTTYAVKHAYTTAANAAKNWYRIANANTKQVYTGNPIHAEFILTAYNSSYDPGYSERWYVRAMVLGRNAHVTVFGGNTAPFSQCRVLYENTIADIDDNDRPAIDIYLNYVLANGTTKIEIEEVYNQGWTFVADGQLAASTVPTGFENTAVGVRGNGVERSTYSDIATYLNKTRRDITSNITLADNNTYRSATLNCTGNRTITLPSINSAYFWCVIKNFNAEADIITIHPSTTSVLIDGSNDDIILRPGEFVTIHSRAANSFTIVGDNRKRTCLVGRSGEVGTDTKHWFRVAQKTLNTRYRDAFILFDVFQVASDSSYMGRLCAHVRVDGTVGVVGNKQFNWLYRGTQLSDDDFAMTTIETSGTSVVVDIWCKRASGYSAFAFAIVSEGFSTDSLDSPAGKWILTRQRATVGDLESLDTGFTTVTNPSVVTLANSITGNAGSATTVTGTAGTSTLAWGSEVTLYTVGGNAIKAKLPANPNSDTKNTAGSTDSSSKLFLIGATAQEANPQTYSHDTAYVGTDGCLYSGGAKVLTAHQSLANYVDLSSTQTITGKKLFTNSAIQLDNVTSMSGSTMFIDTSASAPRGAFPESDCRVGRVYIGDNTSYNGAWFIVDPTITTNKAYYRMVTTNPDNTDSARFSICWDSTKEGVRRRRNVSMGDLLPQTASTYNLGESGNAWQDAYINKIHGISDYTNLKTNSFNANTTLTHGGSGRRVILAMGTITLTVPAPEEGSWFLIKAVNGQVTLNLASNVTVTGITAGVFSGPIHLQPNESILLCYYSSTIYNATISTIRRSGVVGRTGNVPSENPKHWFKIAENYVTATYRDPFICLRVFEGTTGNTIGTLCAHCRIDNTVGVVATYNCYLQWQDSGSGIDLSKYALTTNETSGTGVTIALWCTLTGGYSSLKFEVVSECGQSDQLGNPEWVLTRRRQADGDLAELSDTDFTKIVYSTLTTLKNDTTGKASNVTGTVAIANGGTGATTRLNAVKALTNESVGTPTHFLAITTNWDKAGYTTVAQAKTVLGITGDMGSHSDSEYVHKTGNETISGDKTFANSKVIVGRNTDVGSAIQLINSDVVGDSANGSSGFEVYGSSISDDNKIGGLTVGEYSNNGGAYATIEVNRTVSGVKTTTAIRSLIRSDGSKEFSPSTDNDIKLGHSSFRWSAIYGNTYYYGSNNVEFSTKFVTTDTAQTITGIKTFNSDTLVANQGNAYRIANSAGTGYGVLQRMDGTYWYMLVTANDDPLGTWTSARPITIRLSDGYCCINGKANEANKVQATIAADATTALVQATVASNDCFRIAAGGAANAGWAEIATGDDANEPIYVRQYKGNFTTLQRTATLLDGSGNTSFPGTVTATGFSGPLTGDVTGTAAKATGNANGNEITDTVIKGLSISGKTITYTKIDGNTGTLTTQDTVYTHPTTSGNKHIPSGGSSGQFLGWDSDGTAKWVNNPNTNTDTLMTQNVSTTDSTYPILLCATANATSNQGAKTGIFGSGVKVNPKTSVVSAKGFSGVPTGTMYVTAVKDGGALVNSQAAAWGAIWRAPTKDYQVAGATWSNTNNNVYICYSVTNANVEAGTNTMAKSLVWAADTGTLTTTTFSGALSGNASSATEFSANKDVTLTGDVTGTASSKAGWSVATTLANSGVTAGTYGPSEDVTGNNNATISVPEITVDAKGRVTSVTNRTLTCKNNTYNVYNKTLTIQKNGTNVATFTSNSNTDVTANITVPTKTSELTNDSNFLTTSSSLNASKLTGTIDIARLPQGALERIITVANQTARFALTTSSVQLGDTVKQLDTGVMYAVVDESKLNSNDGYLEYTAGSASSVPWSGITSKPTEFTPSSHTHTKSDITDFPTNVSAFTNDAGYLTAHQSLSNYVTLNTAQEITNTKIFKDATTVRKLTSVEAGNVIPSSDKLISDIWQDKNGKELGRIYYTKTSGGNTALIMRAGDWFSESEGVYSLNASGTNRRAELHLYSDSSGNCCIKPVGLFSTHIKPLNSSVYLGDSTNPFGRVYANTFEFCNAGLLADTDVQTTEEHSIGFFGQNNTPLSYITFQKRPNLKDRVAIRINTTSSSYKSYDFDATCFYPESSNSVDIGSTTNIFKNIYCNNYYKGTTAFGDIVTHNASEFLTSHQSLANYVTLNGAQTISGIKTISTHLRFSSANTRGTAPSANEERDLIDYKDSAGNRISLFETMYYTDKSSKTSIYAYKTTAATGGNIGSIGIGCDASGNVYTYAPTPSSLDNSTKIATTAFVYNTAAKHLAAATNIYVAKVATGNGSGSNTSNYMALADLRTYLATVHMHSSTSDMNSSYNLQILFKAGDSFGNATFDATKMPGVRNLILNTSTGTNSTVDNYSTNSPIFGNINVTGDIVVTMRNLNCTGRISSQYGAQVSIDTYMGISSLMASNSGYLNVAKNMVINVCDAHVDYLFSAVNNGILSMWPGATVTINFRQQCYYTRSLFTSSSNGTALIGYSSFKLTGTEPMAVWGGSGTLTGTSETAAATVEKAVTLASGQTFTLTTNATAKVKFTVDNTANNPTLNIGGTGAKPIYWNNAPVQATMLMKNITYDVKYNGSQFVIQNAVKRLTNNDFGVFRSNGNYNQTYNSGSWNFTGWTLYYGTGIENSNWRGSHIGNIQQNVSTSNNTYPVLISGTANATANASTAPYFAKGVKINPSTNSVYATNYYYGSNNVEFSTKFVTTDTAQTISGVKSFSDNISTKKIISNVAQLQINARSNADSVAVIAGADASEGGGFWCYGKDSANGSDCRIQIYNTTESRYERVDLVGSQFLPSPSGEIDCGGTSNKWKSVYATNYYYGNDNVEFSTKFVTTDTDQTISGTKTFGNGTLIVDNGTGSNVHGEIKLNGSRPGYIVADNSADSVFDSAGCGISILLQDSGKPLHIGAYKTDSNGRVFVDNTNKNPVLSITSGLIRTSTLIPENDTGNSSFRILSQIDYANGDTSKLLDVRFVQYDNTNATSAVYSNDDNKTSLGLSSKRWSSVHATNFYENGTALSSKYALNENFGKGTTTYLYINATDFPTGSGSSIQHLDVVDGTKLYVWYSVCNSSSILDIQPTANRVTTVTGQVWRYLGQTVHATGLGHQGASPTGILGLFRRES